MIKLILSDLDGTLLKKGETALSQNLISKIIALNAKGISFAVASGRCYLELSRICKDVKDIIYFVCLDGAAIIYKDKLIFKKPIDENVANAILEDVGNMSGIDTHIYRNISDIYKIALHGDEVIFKAKQITRAFEEKDISIIPTDKSWYEIVAKGVCKGAAARFLMDKLNISKDEAMAIGDNYNDIEMLRCVTHSYAMEYAWPRVKMAAKDTVKDIELLLEASING